MWECVKCTKVAHDRHYRKGLVTAVITQFVKQLNVRQVIKKLPAAVMCTNTTDLP
jgi:hypothetical protein